MSSTTKSYESLSFFVPLYNEEANVFRTGERTIEALGAFGTKGTLILVDDGSTDATASEIDRLQATYPDQINVVTHTHNQGYGAALRSGLERGLEMNTDLVGMMDGDGQFDPNDMGLLIAQMANEHTDAAIGIRTDRQDRLHRRWLGESWKIVSKLMLHYNLTDVDCGMKVFRSESLAEIVPNLLSTAGATISPELVARLQANHATFSEVRVGHYPRTEGTSTSANLTVILKSLHDLGKVRKQLAQETSKEASIKTSLQSQSAQ